jgi:hypothetical protein
MKIRSTPESGNIISIIAKDLLVLPANKVEDADVVDWRTTLFVGIVGLVLPLSAQQLPDEEVQANFSGYFDNFQVSVIYPNFALTRHLSESTAITGHYLVDLVSAASIRSGNPNGGGGEREGGEGESVNNGQNVDVVTAASTGGGGGEGQIKLADDVRHEIVVGITHIIPDGNFSLNGMYSREHDYSSGTIAGSISRDFAEKNTTFALGFVRSWDRVFPVTKPWTRSVNVQTVDATFNQILSTRLLTQLVFSYTKADGQLADVYRTIDIAGPDSITHYDPISPYNRYRRAIANRFVYRLNSLSSITVGFRYYWDSWDVRSHTISGLYQRHLSQYTTLGVGVRTYFQNEAFFFKSEYAAPERYMTADGKLDKTYSTELQLKFTIDGGGDQGSLPYLDDDRLEYNFSLNWYRRHTDTPDWFTHLRILSAIYFNVGIRYKL